MAILRGQRHLRLLMMLVPLVALLLAVGILWLRAMEQPRRFLAAPRDGEVGQIIEGAGRANFDWFKRPGIKFAVAFVAPRTGEITQLSLPWRTTPPGYGAGTFGTYTIELQSNSALDTPSGTVLARVAGLEPSVAMHGHDDYPLTIPLRATLAKDTLYHLVIYNTHPHPAENWSSVNTVMTRLQPWKAWVAGGSGARGEVYLDGKWTPWSSVHNPWNPEKRSTENGSHIALIVTWADGYISGDPYWSSATDEPIKIWGSARCGELITWDRPPAQIAKIGISVRVTGAPAGKLRYHFEVLGGSTHSGTLDAIKQAGNAPSWVYVTLPHPISLERGKRYRLWFDAPECLDAQHCYTHLPVYGPNAPSDWSHASWGGQQSHLILGDGAQWAKQATYDMSFSLQTVTK